MDEFRTRGFIPWIKIENWLMAFRSIWLSTTRPDGRPHAVPVWYIWDGRALYRVDVKRVMAWEYATVANRTDWQFPEGMAL